LTTLIFDGHHLIHRTAFIPELQRLSSPNTDVPTGPIYGFLKVLRANLNYFKADSCIVAWDSPGGSTYRREIYPDYKANRATQERPEALQHIGEQKEILQTILPYLSVKQMAVSGYEGDDLIHLLIRSLFRITEVEDQSDLDIIVITGDKDLLQVVTDGVRVYRPIADQLISIENFEESTGIPRQLFALRKAVTGDKSDNIDGIQGVGEKTANKLLAEAFLDDESWETDINLLYFQGVCSDHKTKTAKRIAENWKVVVRNMALVDLSRVKFGSTHYAKAKAILEADGKVGTTDIELLKLLGSYEFKEFTKNFVGWIAPFRRLS